MNIKIYRLNWKKIMEMIQKKKRKLDLLNYQLNEIKEVNLK